MIRQVRGLTFVKIINITSLIISINSLTEFFAIKKKYVYRETLSLSFSYVRNPRSGYVPRRVGKSIVARTSSSRRNRLGRKSPRSQKLDRAGRRTRVPLFSRRFIYPPVLLIPHHRALYICEGHNYPQEGGESRH